MDLSLTKDINGANLLNVTTINGQACSDSKKTYAIKTPCACLYTRCGVVPQLTNETVAKLQEVPTIGIISLSTLSEYVDVISKVDGGAPAFTRLENVCPITLCVGSGALQHPQKKSSKKAVIIKNRGGNLQLSPQDYVKMQSIFKCDIQQSELVAKPLAAVDDSLGETRSRQSSFRKNTIFLDEFLKLSQGDSKPVFVAAPYDCVRTVQWIIDNRVSQVSGVSLTTPQGINWNEEQLQLIVECIKLIPSHIPIMVPGPLDPRAVCSLSKAGISLFDTSYTAEVTENGGALCFPLEPTVNGIFCQADRRYELDLEKDEYLDQFKPVMSACTCTTCMKFTRAYLNHLLRTKEMLAKVLLTIHNLHHYMLFMKTVRQCMTDGTLDNYIETLYSWSTKV